MKQKKSKLFVLKLCLVAVLAAAMLLSCAPQSGTPTGSTGNSQLGSTGTTQTESSATVQTEDITIQTENTTTQTESTTTQTESTTTQTESTTSQTESTTTQTESTTTQTEGTTTQTESTGSSVPEDALPQIIKLTENTLLSGKNTTLGKVFVIYDGKGNLTLRALEGDVDGAIKSIPGFSQLSGTYEIADGKLTYTADGRSAVCQAFSTAAFQVSNAKLAPDNTWYKATVSRNNITKIRIVDSYAPADTPDESWDASAAGDGSVMCYLEGNVLTISGNGSGFLVANESCIYTFGGANDAASFIRVTRVEGLDLLDTRLVQNMAGMFNRMWSLGGEINLSTWDMSNVKNTNGMFQGVGNTNLVSFILPDTVKVLGNAIFNHPRNYSGETFTVPAGVEAIGYIHMWYDFGTNVQLIDGVPTKYTGSALCAPNPIFKRFIVAPGCTAAKAVDGILYSADGTRLISVPAGKDLFDNGADGVSGDTFYLPEGITWLNELSFSRNPFIKTLVLPNSYEIIRHMTVQTHPGKTNNNGNSLSVALYCYTGVSQYAVREDNPRYSAYAGCIYSKDGQELIAVPTNYEGSLEIKPGTKVIGQEAFWADNVSTDAAKYLSLTEIYIPASVEAIETDQLAMLQYLLSRGGITITTDEANTHYTITDGKIVAL